MTGNLDIVGTAAVDVIPVAPRFHEKLSRAVLPAADRIGEEAGRIFGDAMADHIRVVIPTAVAQGGRTARNAARSAGDDNAGAFGRAFRNRLQVAFRSLPRPDVRLSTTGFDADLARVRARMESLSEKRIGIDVDVATAAAEIDAIDARLAELGSRSPNIQVRADIATARAELAAMQRQVNDLDRDDVNIRVRANTGQAQAALMQLAVSLGAVAALPVIPIAAAGIGAIASAAVAAAAGVGAVALVAVPAIKGVTEAIQAKTAAEKESATATDNSAAASVRASQNALQMASAQQALSAAHRNAARSIATANRQVEDAERALGQAAARAMEQRRQAAEAVERAERSLTDAKRQSQDAEENLTRARQDAAQQLADLNAQLERGKLDERDATLRVREAQEELNRVQKEYDAGKATALQLERAQLAYDQSVQAAEQQRKDYAQLQKDAEAAKKAGVEGNADVQAAAEQLADAQRNVQDQTQAVADAHRDAAQAQVEAAQTVADAQRNMADAVAAASDAQVQAAEQIATAERGIQSARLASIDTTTQAVSKTDQYREALAKLTPEQRALYNSIAGPDGLTTAYKEWSASLHPDVLPLFTRAVDGAKRALPGLTPLVRSAADGVGDLMDRASADLKGDPFWDRFKKGIADSAKPAIVGLGVSFGNVFKGMAGVLDAFFPHMDSISQRMQDITGDFADWGTSLRGSEEFEKFLDYVNRTGPGAAGAMGSIFGAAFQIGVALSPIAGPLLDVVGAIADGIETVAESAPWLVQAVYGIILATKLWVFVQWALNAALQANPIGLVIKVVAALTAAVVYAWNRWPGFRDAVTGAWQAIQSATTTLWEDFLQPFFRWFGGIVVWLWESIMKPYVGFMVSRWREVGSVLTWLWVNIFGPIFGFMGNLVTWFWANIVKRYLGFVIDQVGAVGSAFRWLYEKGVKPPMDWIADKTSWLYNKGLKPAFDRIGAGVRALSDGFGSAKKSVKAAWGDIARTARTPVNWIIDVVYNRGIKALFDKVAGYVGMDPLPKGPKLLSEPERFATGGRVFGGTPGKDSVRAWLMPGEYVVKTASARSIGYGALEHLNRTGELPGVPGFADGGIVGGAWDWTKDKVSDVIGAGIDWAKTGADLLVNPGKIWSKLTKPILSRVTSGVGSSPMGKALAQYPVKMVGGLKDKIVSAVTSFLGSGGGMGLWEKPVDAPFGTRFGVAGSMWASGRHTGLDFPAPAGTPVHAVADGRVIDVGRSGPYGNHLQISHGGGLTSLYAHMSKLLADMGQTVAQGQTVGRVGSTGNSSGPHLHLEARVNGRPVDPLPYIQGGGPLGSRSPAAAKAYAKSILPQFGWSADQFPPLEKLWEGESNWRWNAKNPSSGAYGIPQSLPASKMASAGSDWRTNPATQIRWGLNYIKNRPDYGSPAAAYSKWLSRSPHWYDDGGYLPPGLNLVANGTGRPEPVFTSGQWDDIRAAKSGGTTVQADVRVFLGDRELTDIVRTEIDVYDSATATELNNGRYV